VSISRYSGLLAPVLIFILAAAPADESGSDAGDRARNRQLLEKWKADAEHYARLQRDLRDFWALPEAKRQRLRRLDKELHDLDAKTRKRLWKVAERYIAWLERLPDDERRRIEATEDLRERLTLIKEIRERQWIERLPQKVREELDKLPAEERATRVAQLREEERQQRKLWQGSPRSKPPTRPVLPPLPPPGKAIVRFKDLPAKAKVEAGSEAAWEKRRDTWERLRKVEGKWPEWALLFHSLLTPQQQARMPPLGASRPSEFPREVANFLRDKLEPKLTRDEKQHLRAAEGKWPEYPKRLLQLAEKHKLEVPGMSLPAFPEAGSNAR
jgi:hypothetical protein